MKFNISTFLGAVCLAIGFLGSQTTASAIPITGGLSFGGNATAQNSSNANVSDLTMATQIAFPNNSGPTAGFPLGQYTTTGSGDFASVTPGSTVIMAPLLIFASPQNLPINAFYSVGGFTFDLLTIATLPPVTSTALVLTGTGLFHKAGFTDTAGTYTLSLNTAAGTYSFSASGAALPDGGTTVALLGLGLVAVEAGRRMLSARSVRA